MTQIVMPMHTNGVAGVMFGGIMMQWIDVCAAIAAQRHAGGSVLTASVDRLDFLSPVQVGEIVVLQAQVNFVARSSMEVGCRVETEHMATRTRRYVTKAYLTFVAVEERGSAPFGSGAEGRRGSIDGSRPRPVPPLELVTADDHRRHAEGQRRRSERLRAAGRVAETPS